MSQELASWTLSELSLKQEVDLSTQIRVEVVLALKLILQFLSLYFYFCQIIFKLFILGFLFLEEFVSLADLIYECLKLLLHRFLLPLFDNLGVVVILVKTGGDAIRHIASALMPI